MTLLDEIQEFFSTKDLYNVLSIDKTATAADIKKAYRKVSLLVHPDRVGNEDKEQATKKFQTLARVHYILSDDERRRLYDTQGILASEDSIESDVDWFDYWRVLFPAISEKDITNFLDTYIGSKKEEEDLIEIYNKYNGDMDKICEAHIAFDEERTEKQILDLIKSGKLQATTKFSKDRSAKKARRLKKSQKEAKEAAQLREEMDLNKSSKKSNDISDLTSLIQSRSKTNFDSLISSLEAKYAKPKTNKRKRP